MIGRAAPIVVLVLAVLASGEARRRLEVRRAIDGIDPTVVDEIELADGTIAHGQPIERTATGHRYRLQEVEVPRDRIREVHAGDPGSPDREDRIVTTTGTEWSGRLVGSGERSLVLALAGPEVELPPGDLASVRRVYETDFQVFLASQMGSVRPLAIYLLWYQADEKLRRRQYWELPAIYERISKVQPFNQHVWLFNGWNLAFNVAAEQQTLEQQWPWIRQGLEFLMKGSRKIPESWEIPFQIAFTISQKCDGEPYFQERVLEVFGSGQRHWREIAADWAERARSLPGHYAFTCSTLFRGTYPYLMAEALHEGDEEGYLAFRKRAQAVLDHHRVAHAEETQDFPGGLPSRADILQRMGFRHLQAAHAPGRDVERAERYFALAAESFAAEGDAPLAAAARSASRAIARVAEGLSLRERKNHPGAQREFRAARTILEMELLPYWLPFHHAIGPAACQGSFTPYPNFVESVYRLVVDHYSGWE